MVLASGAAGSAVTTSNLDDACVTPVPVNSPVTTPAESMRMRSTEKQKELISLLISFLLSLKKYFVDG